jgi:membrane protein implicated in regulation of membrane protease activity
VTDLAVAYWHWWVAGLMMLALEAFLPGAFFLWMGVAALAVGALLLAVPAIPWLWQAVIFAVLAIGSIYAWRRLRPRDGGREAGERAPLNDRARTYLGRVFSLDAPIVNGVGHLRVDDGQWRVTGPDLPVASRVRITAVDGATLKVESAD